MNKNKRILIVVSSIVIGIGLFSIAGVYWLTPAGSLPGYFPGFEAGSLHIHFKHGVAALLLGLVLFAFAWFKSGEKSAQ
jgi:hypothetical protein